LPHTLSRPPDPLIEETKMVTPQTWLITGASQGLGQILAETALERGHSVALTARRVDAVEGLRSRYPDRAIAVQLDVTDDAQVVRAVAETESRFGGVDILVNNVGFGFIGAVEEADPAEYRSLFDANVFGLVEMTRAVPPGMRGRGRGHIINLSSSGGIAASAGFGYYCATKFAVEGLSEALAGEVAPFGIGVTIVEPGSFRTNFRGGSLRSAAHIIGAYADTSGAARTAIPEGHGAQPGDPRKAAAILVDMVERGAHPLRLPLGSDCLSRFEKKIAMLQSTYDEGREIAELTDG
jgi:NAD(P)-dependent dehydrogenase (short-subunit alcohol dehydrogenase family)